MTEIITDQTPPILHGPSDKEKKYDRQLRLWAASGQQALEDAHILLLNSGAGTVGVETLKNLVLPGIGKFTIADDATVGQADLGVNFFLDEDCLGKSRAESCVKLLQELNPDVEGDWFPRKKGESLQTLFENEQKFTLIMYSLPIEQQNLILVQKYAEKYQIPLISIHSAGFYSYFRIHLPGTFPIVDTHPDSTATTDLRLLTPWLELSKFAANLTANFESQSAHDHGHVPYLALLLYYLEQWKETHGSLPSTYKEKTAFRDFVAAGTRRENPEGGEENFDEAVAAVLKTISAPSLSSSVREVFDYKPSETEAASTFWVIADAIKKFHAKHNALPLPGSVPDMKAQSTIYVQLQNIYKAKSRQDVSEVLETVRAHPHGKNIEVAEVETFCKNAAFIKLIPGMDSTPPSLQSIANKEFENDQMAELTMMPLSLLPIYLSLNATSHAPSASSSDIITSLSKEIPDASENERIVNAAKEVARARGGELHNISALTGGMVAQEVIKIITKQYVPIDNTCVFDGITSRTQILRI
ncbi:NEDD8-activating enzyme E1 regulatory subunit [Lachnellula suecica]|uniref:NEDD8-activating enzyme E1 regulatory subunit n=1 Tax=Lachnellula suecica TaxID=602035 RepID=A0A8T9BY17_9HELO|nr:NEDD8-activating enzyme E1 regulatory subunit [Lachnellula suecica]